MSNKHLSIVGLILGCVWLAAPAAVPMGTAVTYQGQIQQADSPVNGTCDFQFSLWDAMTGGGLIGATQLVAGVNVTNGLFTAVLDFGPGAFNGDARWLELAVRTPATAGSGGFTLLSPRQPLTATPYALRAASAVQVAATNVTGTLGDSQVPTNLARLNLGQTFTGTNIFARLTILSNAVGRFAGDGAGLTNLSVTNIVGWSADATVFTNFARLTASQTFSGINLFKGLSLLTNGNNQFAGNFVGVFSGDGSGLTNLPGSTGGGTSSNQPLAWTIVNGASQTAFANHGYLAGNPGQVTFILPASPALGDVVRIAGASTGGWKIAQNASNQVILTAPLGCAGGLNWVSNGPVAVWRSIASSADGTRLVAVARDGVYATSVDSGKSWTLRSDTQPNWEAVACSEDGIKLVGGGTPLVPGSPGSDIYTSTNSGTNWTLHPGNNQAWVAFASSSDGTRLVAAAHNGFIYASADSGNTWFAHANSNQWTGVACSSDGRRVVAVGNRPGPVYVSVDFGVTWVPHGPTNFWAGVASSADGSRLVAADAGDGDTGGNLYTSADFGITWLPRSPVGAWTGVASSADGSRLFAVEDGMAGMTQTNVGLVYTSIDYGNTWSAHQPLQPWHCIATSADGTKVVAGAAWPHDAGSPPAVGSIFTSGGSTTPGPTGGLIGGPDEAVELLYIGGNRFRVLSHEGSIIAY
jgi:hypothetical protein